MSVFGKKVKSKDIVRGPGTEIGFLIRMQGHF